MGASKVTFAVVLAGSVAGFDQAAYKRDVAALLKGVQLSEIALDAAPSTVAAASVRVVATITTTHQAVASAAVSVLEQYARGGAEPSAGATAGSDQGRGGDQGSNQGRLEASHAYAALSEALHIEVAALEGPTVDTSVVNALPGSSRVLYARARPVWRGRRRTHTAVPKRPMRLWIST